MDILKAVILGLVQGLTEFLPVSSSGHLVLVGQLMDVEMSSQFAVAVHIGTLFSVLIYFHRQLLDLASGVFRWPMREKERNMVLFLVIGTIPAVIIGFSFKDFFEASFKNEILAACMLCVTGLLLLLPRWIRRRSSGDDEGSDVSTRSAVIMGLGQAFAILPGISRSGSTIAAGMLSGVNPSKAAEFSFLLSIPAIAGGGLLEFLGAEPNPDVGMKACLFGAIVAFASGLAAIYTVLGSIRKGKFEYFAIYCVLVGIASIIYFGFVV